MQNKIIYKKSIIFFLAIVFCLLGIWQIYRYSSKKDQYLYLKKQNEEMQISKYMILNQDMLSNQKIDYKKLIICGDIIPKNALILQKTLNNKLIYQILTPLKSNDLGEYFLISYKNLETKKEALENLAIIKNQENNEYSCFSGILFQIPLEKTNLIQKIAAFNGGTKKNNETTLSNDELEDQILLNLNLSDLENSKNKDLKIKYFLETEILNLEYLYPNYKHHIYYSFMWFCLMTYMVYAFIFNIKKCV